MHQPEPALLLQQRRGDVGQAADPARREGNRLWRPSRRVHHLLEGAVGRALVRHHAERPGGHQGHRREGLQRPVGKAHHGLVGRLVVVGEEPGVAVGRRARRLDGADRAGGAPAVVDHDRPPEQLGEPRLHDPRDRVGGAARREGHDDLDGPLRPTAGAAVPLRPGQGGRGQPGGRGEGEQASALHAAAIPGVSRCGLVTSRRQMARGGAPLKPSPAPPRSFPGGNYLRCAGRAPRPPAWWVGPAGARS